MIKKFKLYIMLVAVALSSVSCLDKMPEDGIPFDESLQTVSDINLAVIGIYDAFRSKYLYSGNLTLLPDIQTDLVYGVNGNTNVYGDIWRWKEIKPTNTDIEAVYGALYDVINRCNFMLDRADAVRKKTTDDKELDKLDQCCGEAYFARALAYSELVKLFCKAYESDEDAAGQLGVILSEHYLGDETMRRASLKDSYQFILDDLDRAAELLELEEDFDTDTQGTLYDSIYFNEYTVHALRARVLLYMKRWDEAIKYATKVIDSGYYYLSSCTRAATSNASYYKYMWTNDFSTEAIWKVGFTVNAYGGALGQVFANYDYSTLRPDYVGYQPVRHERPARIRILPELYHRIQPRAYMAAADKILRQRIVHQLQHPARQHAESAPPVGTVPHPCRSIRATRPARLRQGGKRHIRTAHGTLLLLRRLHFPEQGERDGRHRTGARKGAIHGRLPPARPETLAQGI